MTIYSCKMLVYRNPVDKYKISAGKKYFSRRYNIIPIVLSNYFDGLVADSFSSQTKGKIYFFNSGKFFVIDLERKFVYQYITTLENNHDGELLDHSDIQDINVLN